ncbi:MAG: ribbon-helix-helix domain-containing protein [Methanosarcina sp.]|jgi:Arc/MetJ-type ribon-helix-helix transcriptional regulator
MQNIKKKNTLNVTVSPYLAKKVDKLVNERIFSSASDLVSLALSEFLVKFPDQKEVSI